MGSEAGFPPQFYGPPLFVYDADGGDGHGVAGVTDMFEVAQRQVCAALLTMPVGAAGTIRLALLDNGLPRPEYRYVGVVARMRRDKTSGGVVVNGNRVAEKGEMGVPWTG